MILDKIKEPNDIKNLSQEEINLLPNEIREFLIDKVSVTGGHLASNLGVVELTIALHLLLDFPKDKIIWDVGHQAYIHKLLTGRKEEFDNLRQIDGISGFPDPSESDCDAYIGGHASNSISAALGMTYANIIQGQKARVVPVIGDGSLTGGMVYEALNNASTIEENFTIILNDNNMSISENVGGISERLSGMRTSDGYNDLKEDIVKSLERLPNGDQLISAIRKTKRGIKQIIIPGMFFEEMDVMYLGPVDGHNINEIMNVINKAFRYKGAVVVHVMTNKGKGFEPAEKNPSVYHGIGAFDKETGQTLSKKTISYTDVFSATIRKLAERDERIVAITAAMGDGTGLKKLSKLYPERFFDVGIAEEHAVTFAAAMAMSGLRPVVAMYSTFLQRAFDQVIHDICMQNLPVTIAIDRAGIVGEDGKTHQGLFDISYLSLMPNMTIMAPKNKWELYDMIKFASSTDGPSAVRYPRGEAYVGLKEYRDKIELGKCEIIHEGSDILLFALGSMVEVATEVYQGLLEKGIESELTNARFAKPFDEEYLLSVMDRFDTIVIMEENVSTGGFAERVEGFLYAHGYSGNTLPINIPDKFIPHGKPLLVKKQLGIDADSILERILGQSKA